jgi:uncharacterized protein with von Willebrand factor type A (vWA) domain
MREKSKRQTGWKALKSHPILSTKEQEEFLVKKLDRRLLQISTGKALEKRKMKKGIKERIQRLAQLLYNSKENSATETKVVKELETLFGGKENLARFMAEVNLIKKMNSAKIEGCE